MAKRWQHHCIEIREAAQQILLGELTRMGKKGRKQLVEHWAQYLPLYTHQESIAATAAQQNPNVSQGIGVSGSIGSVNTANTANQPTTENQVIFF